MIPLLEDLFPTTQLVVGGAAAAIAGLALYLSVNSPYAKARRAGAVLPPGPERAFFVGNLFNFPKTRMYQTFSRWADEYGDVVYVDVAGLQMVVLNSLEVVKELMDKRMGIYSNRPVSTMKKISGLNSLGHIQPGPDFNEQRRVFRKVINPRAVSDYDNFIQRARDALLGRLQGFSGDPYLTFVDISGALITRMAYGEQFFKDQGQELIGVNVQMINRVTWIMTKLWIVDVLPPLKNLPDWFPGATFKKYSQQTKDLVGIIQYRAFNYIAPKVVDGSADDSILAKYLDEGSFSRDNIRSAVSSMYAASTETTSTTLVNFLYCVTLYPEWQRKIHEEMDRVLGRDYLPTREETTKLPVFNAVMKESLRWNAPAPLGVPHVNAREDIWNGYYIPKGTIIHCNIGYILRDRRIWGEDSQAFNPARFLPEFNPRANELPDMWDIPFGFGRRICPGRYLAEHIILQLAAAILVTYEVHPLDGKSLTDEMDFGDSLTQRASNFQCQFKTRS